MKKLSIYIRKQTNLYKKYIIILSLKPWWYDSMINTPKGAELTAKPKEIINSLYKETWNLARCKTQVNWRKKRWTFRSSFIFQPSHIYLDYHLLMPLNLWPFTETWCQFDFVQFTWTPAASTASQEWVKGPEWKICEQSGDTAGSLVHMVTWSHGHCRHSSCSKQHEQQVNFFL